MDHPSEGGGGDLLSDGDLQNAVTPPPCSAPAGLFSVWTVNICLYGNASTDRYQHVMYGHMVRGVDNSRLKSPVITPVHRENPHRRGV